ncbi:hypothetical protein M501DRAFT_966794 [Patellaria atrata CBS 101060]|uniref:RRM domain-containing protein n=1 Tax=Patellaria atrata CBS 101060 TaxID=1346257 RepID=A0A9P4SIZ1_9PEZI|nr:hypothetical protein M501DRAFT_966794 [Patellaria atrata CBS 101060]
MVVAKDIPSFDDIIQADRKKRKAEDLASKIFGKNRRASAPGPGGFKSRNKANAAPSLASRIGVSKRHSSAGLRANPNNPRTSRVSQLPRTNSASQIDRGNRLYDGLQKAQSSQRNFDNQVNFDENRTSDGVEINIRGQAIPFVVIASNFAPGTTAADIEAVIAPIGGELISCRLISSAPTVIAELAFARKSGAEKVVDRFNNKRADGRLLYVYMKDGPPTKPAQQSQPAPQASGSRYARDDQDSMDVDDNSTHRDRYDDYSAPRDRGPSTARYGGRGQGTLVSDSMVRDRGGHSYRY